jgi:hypothetical protein
MKCTLGRNYYIEECSFLPPPLHGLQANGIIQHETEIALKYVDVM